ncbi:hypothetical protein EVAR_31537_1 [Eumeta japonica]|uniref:Uncharacterized protein n=1 Tax=Eumeta variegata TaxID=151549 RepID=A0A4C1V740_EUMVA|nr:hypothetical protein EVAR_31537_1 [Eumeta japonica]
MNTRSLRDKSPVRGRPPSDPWNAPPAARGGRQGRRREHAPPRANCYKLPTNASAVTPFFASPPHLKIPRDATPTPFLDVSWLWHALCKLVNVINCTYLSGVGDPGGVRLMKVIDGTGFEDGLDSQMDLIDGAVVGMSNGWTDWDEIFYVYSNGFLDDFKTQLDPEMGAESRVGTGTEIGNGVGVEAECGQIDISVQSMIEKSVNIKDTFIFSQFACIHAGKAVGGKIGNGAGHRAFRARAAAARADETEAIGFRC